MTSRFCIDKLIVFLSDLEDVNLIIMPYLSNRNRVMNEQSRSPFH